MTDFSPNPNHSLRTIHVQLKTTHTQPEFTHWETNIVQTSCSEYNQYFGKITLVFEQEKCDCLTIG